MGAGFAKQIRDKWPVVYEEYKKFFDHHNWAYKKNFGFTDSSFLMGKVLLVEVEEFDTYVLNLFSQDGISRTKTMINYGALRTSLERASQHIEHVGGELKKRQICFPHKIGCGLGGGNWSKVSAMIEFYFPNATIYKLT
jgi:hypothetical protein